MNALELANWIENGAPFGKYETAKQAVVMLRQQQAEIEALKQQVIGDDFVFVCKRCGDELGIKFGKAQEK